MNHARLQHIGPDELSVQNIYIILLSIAGAESLTLASIVWLRNRRGRGLVPFLVLMAAIAIWTLGYAGELILSDLPGKLICVRIEYFGIVTAPVASLLFAAAYTGRLKWTTPRSVVALAIVPVTSVVLLWTNQWHGLFYREVGLVVENGLTHFDKVYGPWFWVHVGYSYLMLLLALIFIFEGIVRSPQLYRGQILTLALAGIVPLIANFVFVFGLSPLGRRLDLTPFGFTITGFSLAWSLIGYRLLDVVPAARSAAIEGMTDSVIVLDARNRIVDLNPAAEAALNRSLRDVIGLPIVDVVPNQRPLLERFANTGDVRTEIELITVNAEKRIFDLRINLLKNRRGSVTGRLIVLRDISDRKQTERELEKANNKNLDALRVKSRILAIVGHDIRTPLSAIMGYADMLMEGAQGPLTDHQKEVMAHLMMSTRSLHRMMDDLLDQAQLESGTITINATRFDPQSLVKGIITLMKPLAARKELELEAEVAPELKEKQVYGDLARIMQCVNNVVENAIKFTVTGCITVKVFQADIFRWGISITDTGPGMNAEELSRAFDPFWQADSTVTREQKGVGLGLSITKQLVDMMHGIVDIESRPGEGTTFRILLPMKSTSALLKEKMHEKV